MRRTRRPPATTSIAAPDRAPIPGPREPVPTSVTEGPDGALYVGLLTSFPFWRGSAAVLRVDYPSLLPLSRLDLPPEAERKMNILRTGITRNSLKTGTEVVVRGYQSKDALCDTHPKTKVKTCKANGRDVTFPDGRKLFMGSSGTGAPRKSHSRPQLVSRVGSNSRNCCGRLAKCVRSGPIVPAAILFDLVNGGDKAWSIAPYRVLGRQACEAAGVTMYFTGTRHFAH